jgi:hypothetical protein
VKKNALVLLMAVGLLAGNISHADESCSQQLAAKDRQIQSLLDIIASGKGDSGQHTVVVEKPFTCQAMCIENMMGTGFRHPGELYRYNAISSGTTEQDAWNSLARDCDAHTKKDFAENRDKFASANIAGYVTVADMNSDDWETKMVKSFNDDVDLSRFCSDK